MKEGQVQILSKDFVALTFRLGGSEFAVEIQEVQEIRGAEKITSVPNAPSFVEGVMELRGKVIPVIDLRRRFSIAPEGTGSYRVLLVRVSGFLVGMMVDKIGGVLRIKETQIQDVPEIAATQLNREFMRGIVKVGERVIFILNLGQILHLEEANRLQELGEAQVKLKTDEKKEEELAQYVTFPLGNEIYGVEINHVLEIGDLEGLTRIPYVPDFVLGVINVRGTVLWVVDVRQFLNVPKKKDMSLACVILLTSGDKTCGLLVDGAPVVKKIPPAQIQPPLSTLEAGKLDFIKGEYQEKDGDGNVHVCIFLDSEKILTLSERVK